MSATTTSEVPQTDNHYKLTSNDRCDSCGAQAYVRATMPSGSSLLFCAHHSTKHREKLTAMGAVWHDETARLFATN